MNTDAAEETSTGRKAGKRTRQNRDTTHRPNRRRIGAVDDDVGRADEGRFTIIFDGSATWLRSDFFLVGCRGRQSSCGQQHERVRLMVGRAPA